MKKENKNSKVGGFTLIEILVVVAIISLMGSIIIAATSVARAKGNDSKKIVESSSVSKAIDLYYTDKKKMPSSYNCTNDPCVALTDQDPPRQTLEVEDIANPSNPQTEQGKAYKATMTELVSGGYLTDIPKSSGGSPYVYYDYGPGSVGVIFGTTLQTVAPSATGLPNSCRPFSTAGQIANSSRIYWQEDPAPPYPDPYPTACSGGQVYDHTIGTCVDTGTCAPGHVCGGTLPCFWSYPAGGKWNTGTNSCVPASCPTGQIWDNPSGSCVDAPSCPVGQKFSFASGSCGGILSCPSGSNTTYVPDMGIYSSESPAFWKGAQGCMCNDGYYADNSSGPPRCLPLTANQVNFCSQAVTRDYCTCTPY